MASLGFKVDNQNVLTPLLNKVLECGSSSGRGAAPRLPAGRLPDLLYNGLQIAPCHVVSICWDLIGTTDSVNIVTSSPLKVYDTKFFIQVITEVAQVMMQHSAANNLRDEEEEFLRQMLEEEERRDTVYYDQYIEQKSRNNTTSDLTASMQKMGMKEDVVANSNLNPYAAEFVPGQAVTSPANAPSLVHKKNTEKSS
ncbi:uncharacterized protein [Penaeus vannamei]|uniref:uncharacterized protein n=1 Tax=Penaeus vannamei TaxID=6689 RepID=UPI00387F6700